MEDEPILALNGKTPTQAVRMPALDMMKKKGKVFHQLTVPKGLEPSTDVALLNILGYEVGSGFSSRSWFEAMGAGLSVGDDDLCMRCNLIRQVDGVITSHCGGDITRDQCEGAMSIIKYSFDDDKIQFYSTRSFRNILVIKECSTDIKAVPPHDLLGSPISLLRIESDDKVLSQKLNRIICDSFHVLKGFPANGIALWGPGTNPRLGAKINGTMISGVPLVKGIGKAAGMKVVEVEGATGDEKTDLNSKLTATIKALNDSDFVILHIEALDEASHQRDWNKKMNIMERIDNEILMPILQHTHNIKIRVQSDHATSSLTGRHLSIPVEVVEYNT